MITAEKLKLQVKTKAKQNDSQPQDIMQMYFFERLLYRISISEYKHNFILKGGLLLSAIFGDERRTTQDMDTMIKGIELDYEVLKNIIEKISNIDLDDQIKYEVIKYQDIRENDRYGGIKIFLNAYKEHLKVPLSIDISTNDPITPRELEFKYKSLFDDSYISIMAYTIETVIAEKFQTLIEDNIGNTRARDFYDLYMLIMNHFEKVEKDILLDAFKRTFKRRDYIYDPRSIVKIFETIKTDDRLKNIYIRYQNNNIYAKDVSYDDTIEAIAKLIEIVEQEVAVA